MGLVLFSLIVLAVTAFYFWNKRDKEKDDKMWEAMQLHMKLHFEAEDLEKHVKQLKGEGRREEALWMQEKKLLVWKELQRELDKEEEEVNYRWKRLPRKISELEAEISDAKSSE